MAAKDLGPLDWKIPIVNAAGQPTEEFQRRWATQRANNALIGAVTLGSGPPTGAPSDGAEYVDISATPFTVYFGDGGSWHQAGVVLFTDLKDAPHAYAGHGLALVRVKSTADGVEFATQSAMLDTLGSPINGDLAMRSGGVWGLITLSGVLDTLSATQGALLYRDSAAWLALAPGTAGLVLTAGGPAANPSWAAGGGGGFTPSAEMFDVPAQSFHTSASFSAGFYVGRASVQPAKATLSAVCFYAVTASATSQVTPAIYADSAGTPNALLASGPTITGVAQGLNTLALTTPLSVTAGQQIWLGFINTVAAIPIASTLLGIPLVLWAQASNTVPNPAPAASFGGSPLNSMWAKGTRT